MSLSETLELIASRRSTPKLQAPAPNTDELERILACLLNAPQGSGPGDGHFRIWLGGNGALSWDRR